jgi:hypothetical protein
MFVLSNDTQAGLEPVVVVAVAMAATLQMVPNFFSVMWLGKAFHS